MTSTPTASMFNLPAHTVSPAELARLLPKVKAKRFGKHSRIDLTPPSPELKAELQSLIDPLHPDDRRYNFGKTKVVAAIFNATNGHEEGFAIASAWCSKGKAYKGPAGVRKYWNSLNLKYSNPAKMGSLRWMVEHLAD
jgi:hypothetical protein